MSERRSSTSVNSHVIPGPPVASGYTSHSGEQDWCKCFPRVVKTALPQLLLTPSTVDKWRRKRIKIQKLCESVGLWEEKILSLETEGKVRERKQFHKVRVITITKIIMIQ